MKRLIILLCSCFILCCGCKMKRFFPSNYDLIQENFLNENYKQVIDLLDNSEITHKEKKEWYYFFYGVSLYKLSQRNSHDALKYLKIANSYNLEDYNIAFYLGEVYFDVGNYKKASVYFEKCLADNINKPIILNRNPALWLLMSKLKEHKFNYDDFIKKIDHIESEELQLVLSILKFNNLRKEDVLFFIQSKHLNDREKLLIVDTLIEYTEVSESFFVSILECDLPELFYKYFQVRMIYFKLVNPVESLKILRDLNSFTDDSIFVLDCDEFLVNEYFEKYLSFYYWSNDNFIKANNSVQILKVYKRRISSYNIKFSENMKIFYKEFKRDKEFLELQKWKGIKWNKKQR